MNITSNLLVFFAFLIFGTALQAQELGLAGYYSDEYHGRKTASGESYDKTLLTAAHKAHPFGTYIKVTRLDNQRSVVVRINDRGPYIRGRVIDLSRKGAEQLDLVRDGLAEVRLEVVSGPDNGGVAEPVHPIVNFSPRPSAEGGMQAKGGKPVPETPAIPTAYEAEEPTASPVKNKANTAETELYRIRLDRPDKKGFAVQLASLSTYEGALRQVADLQEKGHQNVLIQVSRDGGQPAFKVLLGPFTDRPMADQHKKKVLENAGLQGFVVELEENGSR